VTSDKSYAAEQRLNALGLYADVNGVVRYTAGDGNTYATGISTQYLGADVTVTSVAPSYTNIFSFPLSADTYRIHGKLTWVGQQNAGSAQFLFGGAGGLAASHFRVECEQHAASLAGVSVFTEDVVGLGGGNNTTQLIGLSTTVNITMRIDGIVTFSAGGTLNFGAAEHTATDSFVIGAYSFMEIFR
jgi:hypothetical protein